SPTHKQGIAERLPCLRVGLREKLCGHRPTGYSERAVVCPGGGWRISMTVGVSFPGPCTRRQWLRSGLALGAFLLPASLRSADPIKRGKARGLIVLLLE